MKLYICVVYDLAAETFGNPLFFAAKGAAIRQFGDEVMREAADNAMNQHPEHFVFYHLGLYDTSSGLFETGTPEKISMAVDFKPVKVKLSAVN
jgi:Phage ORF5 protein